VIGSSVRREFLGWSAPLLPRAAALLAERHAGSGELRLDRALVVVPGSRAGRRLVELLVEEAERRELRLVPPRVLTIGELPEELYVPDLSAASPALARRVWTRVLREMPAERRAALFSAPPPVNDLAGWSRLGRIVQRLLDEVAGAGLRFAEVVECCSRGMLFADTERWEVLAAAQERYEAALAEIGRGDRGSQRIAAAEGGMLPTDRPIWLCGVAEMPRVTQRLVERLAAAGGGVTALVHAPAEEADAFDGLGCVLPERWADRHVSVPEERLRVVGRPADQAREVVELLTSLEGRYAAEQIILAVPDEELFPYLEQQLTGAGVPVHVGQGTPVERTRAARLLEAIAGFAGGRRFEAAAALARHPDLIGALDGGQGPIPDPSVGEDDRAGGDAHEGGEVPLVIDQPVGWDAEGGAEGGSLREEGEIAMEAGGADWSRGGGGTIGALGLRGDALLVALDRHFSEVLPARLGGSGPISAAVAALARRLDSPALLGRLRRRRPLAAWAPELLELLVEVYGAEPLDRGRPEHRRLIEALQAIRRAALELHQLPPEVDEECDATTAIAILLDELSGSTVAPEPDEAAVELLGWLELHLDDAPVAIVTGFNEGFLPESTGAHAFLPNSLRAALGLVDNERRYARDAYQLTALLASREEVALIAGRRTATGDPLRPSRLMFAVPGGTHRPANPAVLRGRGGGWRRHGSPRHRHFRNPLPVAPAGAGDQLRGADHLALGEPLRGGARQPLPLRARPAPRAQVAGRFGPGAGRARLRQPRPRSARALRSLLPQRFRRRAGDRPLPRRPAR
jgi:ATP-dependent helicase/nuclease subunit B